MRTDFLTREFAPEDASAVDELWVRAFGGYEEDFPGSAEAVERGAVVLAQTGNRLVVAEVEFKGRVAGAARLWADDGVGWFDMLAASVTGAGKALVRRMERDAQDAGIRWLRTTCPDYRPLPDYFSRIGYQTVGRVNELLTLERRLPLLTVREQRRADAAAISALTGEDPWPFEQGHRPGWFVLADGERVAGVVAVRTGRTAIATITAPVLAPVYGERGLELWMIERAAGWAATNGCVTAETPAIGSLRQRELDLEARHWFRDGAVFRKDLSRVNLDGAG